MYLLEKKYFFLLLECQESAKNFDFPQKLYEQMPFNLVKVWDKKCMKNPSALGRGNKISKKSPSPSAAASVRASLAHICKSGNG